MIDDTAAVKAVNADQAETVTDAAVAEDVVNHRHGTGHDAGQQLTCTDCDFTTEHRRHYTRHVARCHRGKSDKPTECDQESLSASSVNALAKKARSNPTVATLPCPCCNDQFETAAKLQKHLHKDHGLKENIFSCNSCTHRFVYTSSLFVCR